MLEDAKKVNLDIKPIAGVELQDMVESIFRTPKASMDSFLAAVRPEKK